MIKKRQLPRSSSLLYEKGLSSFHQLMHEIRLLDIDGGIRTPGKYGGKKCLLFVTKAPKGYAVAVYSTKTEGKNIVPDKRITIQEFEDEEEVKSLLEKTVSKPVKAYSY